MSDETGGVFVPLPLPSQQVFRYRAADDVLELLYRNPHREFTVTQLRETTGHGGKSVDSAIGILEGLGLVVTRREGRNTLVRIDRRRLRKPDDPLLEIPQEEFRDPVRAFVDAAAERQGDNLVGVVLFGSVARGDADRTSDIDLQVIVENDLLESRRALQEIRQEIESRRFDGNRYEFQLLVESVASVENYAGKLAEIHAEGVTLHSTDRLDEVREVIFDG